MCSNEPRLQSLQEVECGRGHGEVSLVVWRVQAMKCVRDGRGVGVDDHSRGLEGKTE